MSKLSYSSEKANLPIIFLIEYSSIGDKQRLWAFNYLRS